VETPSDSGHEPTPLLAVGLRYVEQLIIRPGQRARYRAQLKALAVLTPDPELVTAMPPTRLLILARSHAHRHAVGRDPNERADAGVPVSPRTATFPP